MSFLIGIDEAGRGPLAGPIAVGAFLISSPLILKKFRGVKESKQLSAEEREEWFEVINDLALQGSVGYSVSFCQASSIDERGLTWAVNKSIDRCLKKLELVFGYSEKTTIKLDGLLHAPMRYKNQQTIIGGDDKVKVIALASVCAKVLRDRKMKRLAEAYPEYGFDIHKGYGTKDHYRAINMHGLCPEHRRSFLKNFVV